MCTYIGPHTTIHSIVQVWDLYHFTDEITKDMREGRGWYAAWEVGRRLLFILLFYLGVYLDSSLVSVSAYTLHCINSIIEMQYSCTYCILCTHQGVLKWVRPTSEYTLVDVMKRDNVTLTCVYSWHVKQQCC